MLLDDAGNVTAFVGRPDSIEEHDRIIPFALVGDLNPLALTLSCTLQDLPNYTEEIVNELEEPDAE